MHLIMRGKEKERVVLRSGLLYQQSSNRKEKSRIIENMMQYIGYKTRKHVITILNKQRKKSNGRKKVRRKILNAKQIDLLREIWAAMGYPCSKLMQASLQDWVEARNNLQNKDAANSCDSLPKLSAATIDRALAPFKIGSFKKQDDRLDLQRLKQSIPLVNRREPVVQPGHLSIDTEAHCGGNLSGDFVWTLTVTDELTLWTQNRAIWNKGQYGTCAALSHILREIPVRIRAINSDTGSEFINRHMQRFF